MLCINGISKGLSKKGTTWAAMKDPTKVCLRNKRAVMSLAFFGLALVKAQC